MLYFLVEAIRTPIDKGLTVLRPTVVSVCQVSALMKFLGIVGGLFVTVILTYKVEKKK